MTRIILTLILLAISSSLCFGQPSVSIRAGANVSSIHFKTENKPKYSPKIGYQGSVSFEFNVNEKLFLRPEIGYTLKGGRLKDTMYNSTGTLDLHYINIPLLFGYRLMHGLSVYTGTELGYRNVASYEVNGQKYNPGILLREFDLGVVTGLYYSLSPVLDIDLRYTHGFNMLMEYNTYDMTNGKVIEGYSDGSNRTLQLGLSYRLTPLKD